MWNLGVDESIHWMICSLGNDGWGPPSLAGSLFSEYVCIFWPLVMFRWYKKSNIDVEFPWECGVGIQGCMQTLGMAGPEGRTNLCSVEQTSSAICMEVQGKLAWGERRESKHTETFTDDSPCGGFSPRQGPRVWFQFLVGLSSFPAISWDTLNP